MGKKIKKSLATFLCVVMCVTSVPLSGFVGLELPDWSLDFSGSGMLSSFAADEDSTDIEETEEVVDGDISDDDDIEIIADSDSVDDSGSCGDNATYTFDSASGTLAIEEQSEPVFYYLFAPPSFVKPPCKAIALLRCLA